MSPREGAALAALAAVAACGLAWWRAARSAARDAAAEDHRRRLLADLQDAARDARDAAADARMERVRCIRTARRLDELVAEAASRPIPARSWADLNLADEP